MADDSTVALDALRVDQGKLNGRRCRRTGWSHSWVTGTASASWPQQRADQDTSAGYPRRIKRYTEPYNLIARPLVWTASADSILAKIERLCKAIGGTQH